MAKRTDTIWGNGKSESKQASESEKEFGKLAHANTNTQNSQGVHWIQSNMLSYAHGTSFAWLPMPAYTRAQHMTSHRIGGKKPIKYKHDWRALAQLKYSQITHELKIQFLKSLSRAHSTCISDCCSIFHITNTAHKPNMCLHTKDDSIVCLIIQTETSKWYHIDSWQQQQKNIERLKKNIACHHHYYCYWQ